MFSSSNSYLGGANSGRPGQQPPFAQQPQYTQFATGAQQQPQPPSQPGFAPQPTGYGPQLTGYGGPQLQPQPTGFPGGQLQPQFTGFPASQPTGFQSPPVQQPQFTGFPPQNAPSQLQVPPQNTALPMRTMPQTSSEIANSFTDGSGAAPPPPPKPSGNKVPNIRLSFITAQDQAKFEQLFKSAVGDSQTMSG